MISTCRVKLEPDGKFVGFVHGSSLPDKTKKIIGSCTEVELIPARGEIKFFVRLKDYAPRKELEECACQIASYMNTILPDVKQVSFEPFYECEGALSEILPKIWTDLVDSVCETIPVANGWLRLCKYKVDREIIVIQVLDENGKRLLAEKNVARVIEDILLRRYGKHARVMLEVGRFSPEEVDGTVKTLCDDTGEESDTWATHGAIASGPGRNSRKSDVNSKQNSDISEEIIFGKGLGKREKITPVSELDEESGTVTVEGKILSVEKRRMKNGKNLITFTITDYEDSIQVKVFEEENRELKTLESGIWARVKGQVRYDTFSRSIVLNATDIVRSVEPLREDKAAEKRVELHAHTKMSAMDGLTPVDELVKLAKHFGHKAIAVTDHGNVQIFPEFYAACKKAGIKPVFGMEGYLLPDVPPDASFNDTDNEDNSDSISGADVRKGPTYHIIILARNRVGLKNLYRLVTESHISYFYKKPRIPRSVLLKYREGLILGSACEAGELYRAILDNAGEDEILKIASFYDYLEIQPLCNNEFLVNSGKLASVEELKEINRKIYETGKKLGKKTVATGDLHYLNPKDEIFRKILMAGQKYEDLESQAPLYFRTTDEMLKEFEYLSEEVAYEVVVKNTAEIADSIEELIPIPKETAFPVIEGAEEEVRKRTMEKAHELYGNPLPEIVRQRLEKELTSIIGNGFATLYLIAEKLVKKSNEDGYLVGSRGSVGSSFVATMLGITEVNPLPVHHLCPNKKCRYSIFYPDSDLNSGYDLGDMECPKCGTEMLKEGQNIPFETFLGLEGNKVPDIDLNFSGEYQARIHKYVEEVFGAENVYRAGTISTLADKTALGFVKGYLEERKINKRDAEKLRLAAGCTGVKRTTGQHPGGIMIVPKGRDVHEFTPVNYPANDPECGVITTHFDYHSISSKLLKLDLLGHDDPTFIRMLQDFTGVDVYSIRFDDKETLSIFSSLDALGLKPEQLGGNELGTLGIPEFGTKFVRGMLMETRPTTFGELVRISGLSHGTDVWLNNAQEFIQKKVAKLSEVISVRDDIMNFLTYMGLDMIKAFEIMENVRKGKGVTEEQEKLMKKHGVPEWYIESCKRIKYMFPKAHAAAYVMMAFRIAWFKVRYPQAFYAVYFSTKGSMLDANIVIKGSNYIRKRMKEIEELGNNASVKEQELYTCLEIALEMLERKLKFYPVDIYKSDAKIFKPEGKDGILCPLSSLQGVGESAAQKIVEEREKGEFISVEDFKNRARLNRTAIDALREHGALKNLPESGQFELF